MVPRLVPILPSVDTFHDLYGLTKMAEVIEKYP